MKLVTFDIETALIDADDVLTQRVFSKSLGITCAAIFTGSGPEPEIFRTVPHCTVAEAKTLVERLLQLRNEGYSICTWNGCSFDFQVLAMESGMHEECAELALTHIDAMLFVTFQKGYFLSLQKAAVGAGLQGKQKTVTLRDGTIITDMSGGKAPQLWAEGEYDAVINYLKEDVVQLMQLIKKIDISRSLNWISNSGKPIRVNVPKLYTVAECFTFPEPDVSWMQDPPKRSDFIDWMPEKYKLKFRK